MSIEHLKNAIAPATQREPLPGQIQNSAGGFSYQVDDWKRLERFLILGSEGGSYYATEQKLSRENAQVVERCAKLDGARLVNIITEISFSGRAPKNDPAILALAMASRLGDENCRRLAYAAVPKVCRIGTHLYHFVQFSTQLGGWGRGLRRAVGDWYNKRPADNLANQLVKYQSRDGWSSRDLLRLSHPRAASPSHAALYKWATAGELDYGLVATSNDLDVVAAFEAIKKVDKAKDAIDLIVAHKLPRECVPTQWLTDPAVWEALLPHMGLTALIRNLGTMTKIGLVAPLARGTGIVVSKLANTDELRRSRVHPLSILMAMKTYQSGHGLKGSSTWTAVQPVVDALDAAFYGAFQNVRPTGKNTLLALDVSGSMTGGTVGGMAGITPRVASCAMALVTAATEPNHHIMGFSGQLVDVPVSPKMRLDDVIKAVERIPMGSTDCSLPMLWAQAQLKNGIKVESFAVYTDSETWCGGIHPKTALQIYRRQSGVDAKSAVVGLVANKFTIADPTDPGMMDFVGFDAAAPAVMADFFRGDAAPGTISEDAE